jgi:hypothetical protein
VILPGPHRLPAQEDFKEEKPGIIAPLLEELSLIIVGPIIVNLIAIVPGDGIESQQNLPDIRFAEGAMVFARTTAVT